MKTVRISNLVFDKALKTLTFSDFASIELERIVSVTNVTRGNQLFYNKLPGVVGTVATNVLTFNKDTNNDNNDNADKFLVEYIVDNTPRIIVESRTEIATGNSSDIINYSEDKGGLLYFDVTAISGAGAEITFKLQVKDNTGHYIDLPGAATIAVTANGQKLITLYPGVTEAANSKVSAVLPRKYRVAWTIAGATPSVTFSVSLDPIQ